MQERLDVVLFGATGYTGSYCLDYVQRLLKEKRYSWGVAGRSNTKLKQVLATFQKSTSDDLSSVPIIIADVHDYDSVRKMTAQAKVVINCCGPFRLYGEMIVKACVETKTHQVDVCADPRYMEYIQLKYHKAAQENGIYIISACGFNSIPTDFGVLYAIQEFPGTLNSAEVYQQIHFGETDTKALLNFTAWESIIDCMTLEYQRDLKKVHNELYPKPLPKLKPELKERAPVHKFDLTNTWNVPLMGADPSVVFRTQNYLYETKNQRPVQMKQYLGLKTLFQVILMAFFGGILQLLAIVKFTKNLLLKYSELFSMGYCTYEGPSRQTNKRASFTLTISGKGWKEKLSEPCDSYNTPPTESILCKVSGSDPGYGVTCLSVTLAALMVLEESERLPKSGGVYTPGAAFHGASFMERLIKNGLKFEVIQNA